MRSNCKRACSTDATSPEGVLPSLPRVKDPTNLLQFSEASSGVRYTYASVDRFWVFSLCVSERHL